MVGDDLEQLRNLTWFRDKVPSVRRHRRTHIVGQDCSRENEYGKIWLYLCDFLAQLKA
jgi:hypothetical protein